MAGAIATLGVIGAGAWGTALAATAARNGHAVRLWAREPEVVAAIASSRENRPFLPGVTLPEGIVATSDMAVAADTDAVLLVSPAQYFRSISLTLAPLLAPAVPVVICAKGIECGTGALMSEIADETLPGHPLAVLSGPTFAREVASGLPTAVTLACADFAVATRLVEAIGSQVFRPYATDDVIGTEVGGAVKNVLAIACGIAAGRALGDNARAAIITRGLAEIGRLSAALGGRPETLMGLAGVGDLVLTCSSQQSRNFSLGLALGSGISLADALDGRDSVVEGVATAKSVAARSRALGLDMPICFTVDAVLHHGADLDEAIEGLLTRPFRHEGWA